MIFWSFKALDHHFSNLKGKSIEGKGDSIFGGRAVNPRVQDLTFVEGALELAFAEVLFVKSGVAVVIGNFVFGDVL